MRASELGSEANFETQLQSMLGYIQDVYENQLRWHHSQLLCNCAFGLSMLFTPEAEASPNVPGHMISGWQPNIQKDL